MTSDLIGKPDPGGLGSRLAFTVIVTRLSVRGLARAVCCRDAGADRPASAVRPERRSRPAAARRPRLAATPWGPDPAIADRLNIAAARNVVLAQQETIMAPRIYPGSTPGPTDGSGPAGEGANAPEHRIGADVDSGDQVSSIVLLGLALAGAVVSTGVFMLIG